MKALELEPSSPALQALSALRPFDAKCFACHRSAESLKSAETAKAESEAGRTDKPCPVAQKNCVSCHMTRIEVPGAHFKFTDHRIRIVREGEPFPN